LGTRSPRILVLNTKLEKSPAAFLGKEQSDLAVAFWLTFIDSRGTAASYAESVNFERWGLED